MTATQLIADTIAVTNHLRQRFGKDKIYLMGHSWGGFLGIRAAVAAPEFHHAYIGMGQVSYQLRSEMAAHGYMTGQYRAQSDAAMAGKLDAAPASMTAGLSDACLRLRDDAIHGLGTGITRDMRSVFTGVFLQVWRCSAYSLREKINIWRGLPFSRRFLW